jgi:hypothetical protein
MLGSGARLEPLRVKEWISLARRELRPTKV